MTGRRRPRTPNFVVNGRENLDNSELQHDSKKKRKSLRTNRNDEPSFFEHKRNGEQMQEIRDEDIHRAEQGYVRLRNERLERLEQPLFASDTWRDVFSGDPVLGKPSSTLMGPWEVWAFALLGLVVVLSAIFLHMVAENHSDSHRTPYNNYRRRQRHARRMYKTRKKKTDEWSDDEEEMQNSYLNDHDTISVSQYQPYHYDPGVSPGFVSQEHRQRRTSFTEQETPPRETRMARNNYYMPVNPTYKSPSANMMNVGGVHRRGVSPSLSFNSSKSGGKSPGQISRTTASIGAYSSSSTAPISGRLRVPSTPEGKDIFPSPNISNVGSGLQGLAPMLPTPPEESQLSTTQALHFGNQTNTHELGARPLNASTFSSFASAETSHHSRRRRGSSADSLSSGSLQVSDLLGTSNRHVDSNNSDRLYESHHQSLLISPGNHEVETPQVRNNRRLIVSPEFSGARLPDLSTSDQTPFMPALERSSGTGSGRASHTLHYASTRPPRSVLLDELRIIHMETGSMHWRVREDVSEIDESNASFEGDVFDSHIQDVGDNQSSSEEGSDIPIPSGDPRGGIKHKRDDLTKDTNAYKSLQSNIEFEDLHLEEVIGGGGFGQVWRATWFGTPVAVKVLTGSAQNTHIAKAILEEFKAEINLLKGMRHPNICLYMGACVKPPNRAIVTELAANGSVWDALRLPLSPPYIPADGSAKGSWPIELYFPAAHSAPPKGNGSVASFAAPIPPKGTWPWHLVKRVASGAARGMAYLHHGNPPVLHRDLKSANLLLDDAYTVKVCDFGLSRLKAQARSMTGNCGTVQWMAPEVLANKDYDEKADVFSYGIILWELLSRECPYEGMTAIQCALAVLNRDKRPDIPKWCPPGFHALIKACIKMNPDDRPSFSEIIPSLEKLAA